MFRSRLFISVYWITVVSQIIFVYCVAVDDGRMNFMGEWPDFLNAIATNFYFFFYHIQLFTVLMLTGGSGGSKVGVVRIVLSLLPFILLYSLIFSWLICRITGKFTARPGNNP